MQENDKLHPIFCGNKLWSNNANSSWLATTIVLDRNIEKFKFPGKLDTDRRKQIVSLVSKEILAFEGLEKPVVLKAEDLSALQKEFLVEHFLTNKSFHQANVGEAFLLDETGAFLIALNIRDHIHFELIDTRGELENTWNRLFKLETHLGKSINYSYSSKFGFLTAEPTQCGTALIVTVFLQVPALIHTEKIDEMLEKLMDDSLMVTGIQGSPTEIIGDVLAVQNNYTLGLTEENIITSLRSFTTKLLVEEHSARSKIQHSDNAAIKDKVSRAYGILIHSYQIDAVEALNAISLIKLGVELGWVSGVTLEQLNDLFFNCRRAHLQCQIDHPMTQEEIPHRRAEYIHAVLKNVKLTV